MTVGTIFLYLAIVAVGVLLFALVEHVLSVFIHRKKCGFWYNDKK